MPVKSAVVLPRAESDGRSSMKKQRKGGELSRKGSRANGAEKDPERHEEAGARVEEMNGARRKGRRLRAPEGPTGRRGPGASAPRKDRRRGRPSPASSGERRDTPAGRRAGRRDGTGCRRRRARRPSLRRGTAPEARREARRRPASDPEERRAWPIDAFGRDPGRSRRAPPQPSRSPRRGRARRRDCRAPPARRSAQGRGPPPGRRRPPSGVGGRGEAWRPNRRTRGRAPIPQQTAKSR